MISANPISGTGLHAIGAAFTALCYTRQWRVEGWSWQSYQSMSNATTIRLNDCSLVGKDNVATFIKELILEPEPGWPAPPYQPGDYLQLDIPAYGEISLQEIAVKAPFAEVWRAPHVFDFHAENATPVRRNYSVATNPAVDKQLRFNVRIATPPRGQDCPAGAGSA